MFNELIHWSKKEYSHLPWRKNRTLYKTLVSEIMLQQTTVGTVKNHFERFLSEFPDLQSLSQATESELLIAWKGLGYYRRAKNLKKIAEYIVSQCNGTIPQDLEHLLSIPGIGPYTANAILTIGMNQSGLPIDANLERVLARIYEVNLPKGLKLHQELHLLFKQKKILIDHHSSRDLYESLMDLGRTFCQANKVSCELCPMKKNCLAFKKGNALEIPKAPLKNKLPKEELHLLRLIVSKDEKILAYLKNDSEWLSGQWEIPTYILDSTDKNLNQYPKLKKKLKIDQLPSKKTNITKYKITNYILKINEKKWTKFYWSKKTVWLSKKDWNKLSAPSLKMLD